MSPLEADAAVKGAKTSVDRPRSATGGAGWMLALLTTGFGLNLLDRQIVSILAEPIKQDLQLADWQLGALTGLSFALLYSVAALPIARLADRSNRVTIVGIAILAWSIFTALSGMAANFLQMLLLRVGVGLGEAGGAPPSQSLIVDTYPPAKRAGALATFAIGSPIGAAIGLIGGGVLADMIGWRWTMVVAGAPGLVVGALVLITLRDRHRDKAVPQPEIPKFGHVLSMLLARRAFMLMAFASALHSFVSYGMMAFAGSFYLRNHLPELTEVSANFGLKPLGAIGIGLGVLGLIGGMLGSLVGGRLGDKYGSKDLRALAIIPAIGSLFGVIGYFGMFTMPGVVGSLAIWVLASFGVNLWNGPGALALQRLAGSQAKATGLAVALFLNSAIGLSFGPLFVGLVSDALTPSLGSGEGLRAGMLICLTVGLGSAFLYYLASRRIVAEIEQVERNGS